MQVLAICFLYAPLYPPFYPLTAIALCLTYVATRYALSVWWARPPQVSELLLARLRMMLGLLLPLHWSATAAAASKAEHGGHVAAARSDFGADWRPEELRCGVRATPAHAPSAVPQAPHLSR